MQTRPRGGERRRNAINRKSVGFQIPAATVRREEEEEEEATPSLPVAVAH